MGCQTEIDTILYVYNFSPKVYNISKMVLESYFCFILVVKVTNK